MSERARYLLLAVGLTAGLVAYYAVALATAMTPRCANDIVAEVPSPSGSRKAIVLRRNCGATTSYGTDVSLLETGRPAPDEDAPGNIARVRAPAIEDFPRARHGGPEVQVQWVSDSLLVVRHHPRAHHAFAIRRYSGVRVWYRDLP